MKKSEKINKVLYLIALLLLVILVFYHNYYFKAGSSNGFSINNYEASPQAYGERKIEQFGRIINISRDYFYFDLGGKSIKIYGTGITKPTLGETVIFANYGKDGKIRLIDYHNYNFNYVLYVISVLALVVFFVIFLKEWKITKRGFKNA